MKKESGWSVGDALRMHPLQEAQVIHMAVNVGKQVRCPASRFAMLRKLPERLHHSLGGTFACLCNRARIFEVNDPPILFEELGLVVI